MTEVKRWGHSDSQLKCQIKYHQRKVAQGWTCACRSDNHCPIVGILSIIRVSLSHYSSATDVQKLFRKLLRHACFSQQRVNFLHRGWYGAVFWISAVHSADNVGMFLLFPSRAYTEPRPPLLFVLPHWQRGSGSMEGWEVAQPEQVTSTDQGDIPDHMTSCSICKVGGRRRKEVTYWSDGICLPKCSGLSSAGCQIPPKATVSLPFPGVKGRGNKMEKNLIGWDSTLKRGEKK